MKTVLQYLKKYKLECFMAPLFKLLEACFDLFVPVVVKMIMDVGIKNGDTSYIIHGCLVLVALGIIGLTCSIIAQYFAARAAVGTSTGLRHTLFAHLQGLSYSNADKLGKSSMITRMTSDINQVQNGVNMFLRLFLRSPIIVFGAMIMAYAIDFADDGNIGIAHTFAVIIPALAVVVFTVILAGAPLFRKVQGKLDRVTGKTRENLNGVRVIRAFSKEQSEIEEFNRANHEHTKGQRRAGMLTALMNPMTYVLVNIGIISVVYFSAIEINTGSMTQGDLFAMYNYMSQILVELVKLANTIVLMTKSIACAKRIQSVLDIPTGMESEKGTSEADENAPAVEFKNVTLNYSGEGDATLENIDVAVKAGETVGIIGSTGSGKTSLVNMIPRFYDASAGEVRVFGKNVKEYDLEDLREKVAVVPQKAVLFKGTIKSNLLWGNENATDEQLAYALEIAQAADFVSEKEGGINAPVEQLGKNLSGGQRQRLTIARAIVKNAPILILDDSASALDFATEARLRHALGQLGDDTTVFIVSQRTSSISHADKIIVLDDGRIVGLGKHDDLLESCSVYREIYDSQFKGGDE